MATHIEVGKRGEELANDWLISKGFTIVHRNWKHTRYEIDIIALKNNVLCFIEVKCRNECMIGNPEDSVTRKKFKHIQRASDQYLSQHPGYKWIQYHILSITLFNDERDPEFFLLEDVFL
jgi:putative endonuclease